MMILDKVAEALLGLLETIVNDGFIDPINRIFKSIKRVEIDFSPFGKVKPFDFINTIGRLCIPYKDIKDCRSEAELAELAALLGCSWDDKSLWKRCYYERVKSICLGDDEMVSGYKDLFEGDSPDRAPGQVRENRRRCLRRRRPVDCRQLFDGANQEVNAAAQRHLRRPGPGVAVARSRPSWRASSTSSRRASAPIRRRRTRT